MLYRFQYDIVSYIKFPENHWENKNNKYLRRFRQTPVLVACLYSLHKQFVEICGFQIFLNNLENNKKSVIIFNCFLSVKFLCKIMLCLETIFLLSNTKQFLKSYIYKNSLNALENKKNDY